MRLRGYSFSSVSRRHSSCKFRVPLAFSGLSVLSYAAVSELGLGS